MSESATVVIQLSDDRKEVSMDAGMLAHFDARLVADRDRHSSNATSFEKVLELQYAQSQTFRDANSARIVMEAGSGRTRAESNGPDNTAAQKS